MLSAKHIGNRIGFDRLDFKLRHYRLSLDIVCNNVRFGKYQDWKMCARSNRCRAHCFLSSLICYDGNVPTPHRRQGLARSLKGIDHMTSTLCQSAALALALIIIALWVTKLAEFFGLAVKAILTIAEFVRPALPDCAKTGPRLLVFWYRCLDRFISRRLASFVAASGAGAERGRSSWVRSSKTDGMGLI
jgi:hypothetical protein